MTKPNEGNNNIYLSIAKGSQSDTNLPKDKSGEKSELHPSSINTSRGINFNGGSDSSKAIFKMLFEQK